MKRRALYIVAMVFLAALSRNGWAIRNPVGRGTVPPSSVRSGLIRSPNPIDTSSNLVVTGNVRGGKHFRGIVPYRATSSFGAATGSSSLDSFLRHSAGSESFGRYTEALEPYYSPSVTVTTTMPGRSGVFRVPTADIDSRAASESTLPIRLKGRALSGFDGAVGTRKTIRGIWKPVYDARFRPVLMTREGMEKAVSARVDTYGRSRRLTAVPPRPAMEETPDVIEDVWELEQPGRELKQTEKKAVELKKSLTEQDESLRLRTSETAKRDIPKPFELQRRAEQPGKGKRLEGYPKAIKGVWGPDVYEQMKQQIYSFGSPSGEVDQKAGKIGLPFPQWAEEAGGGEKESAERSFQKKSSTLDEFSDVELSTRAKSILGKHKTFASFSEDKFDQHIRAAEEHLKQGKYYQAADTYTLALIYKPEDSRAYGGKSHALFAAGEYMSSALFLARALERFPEYARSKVDIETVMGDRDKLESRIADVEQWQERSGSAELQFLLGYIYYQIGRLEWAKKAVDEAYEKMPEASAVIALKKAVDDAMKK